MPAWAKKVGRQDVGQRLRTAREARGVSPEEVEQAIKIHAHHIKALEAGQYEDLPILAWGRGFLITYANYLRLDGEQLANDLFPLRRPSRARLYLGRRWRTILAVFGALGVALALILAALAASYKPFLDAVLEHLIPGLVLGYEPQLPLMVGIGQIPFADQPNLDVVLVNTESNLGGVHALLPAALVTSSASTGGASETTYPVLAGTHDIATCGRAGDEVTDGLLANAPGTGFTAGDNVYPDGSSGDFFPCYDPDRFAARTGPVVGNHEYQTVSASGYFDFFGDAARDPTRGSFSCGRGGCHHVVLESRSEKVGDRGPRSLVDP